MGSGEQCACIGHGAGYALEDCVQQLERQNLSVAEEVPYMHVYMYNVHVCTHLSAVPQSVHCIATCMFILHTISLYIHVFK